VSDIALLARLLPFSDETLYISKNSTPWGHGDCKLPSPDLTFSNKGIFLQNLPLDLSLIPKEGIWIGYAKTLKTYQYVGKVISM